MKEARRTGWETTLAYQMKLRWLEGVVNGWFNGLGIFREYKEPLPARLSTLIGNLMSHARDEYPTTCHSNDETGVADEYIPEFVKFVKEFDK